MDILAFQSSYVLYIVIVVAKQARKLLEFQPFAYWWCCKYHQWVTRSLHACNDICKEKREDLTESNGVVPAEYPPKVKLELFSQL